MTHITATEQPILYTVVGQLSGEDVLISGVTPVGNLTGCADGLTMLHASSENAYLGEIAAIADKFPLLPDSGWLEAGTVYRHGGGHSRVSRQHADRLNGHDGGIRRGRPGYRAQRQLRHAHLEMCHQHVASGVNGRRNG